jgi:hypothetical protein
MDKLYHLILRQIEIDKTHPVMRCSKNKLMSTSGKLLNSELTFLVVILHAPFYRQLFVHKREGAHLL